MASMSSLPLLCFSSAAIQAQGITPAEGWPVQEQSSQSRASDMVPSASAAFTAASFSPVPHSVTPPPSPPLASRLIFRAFSMMGVPLEASAAPTVWSRIIFARSTTSGGRSSYLSPTAYSLSSWV